MGQDNSKLKSSGRHLSKRIKAIYFCLLHLLIVILAIALVVYVHEMHSLNSNQLQAIAVKYALEDCLVNSNTDEVRCNSIKVSTPTPQGGEVPYWKIDYYTASGNNVKGSVYLNRFGDNVTDHIGKDIGA